MEAPDAGVGPLAGVRPNAGVNRGFHDTVPRDTGPTISMCVCMYVRIRQHVSTDGWGDEWVNEGMDGRLDG